VPPLASRLERRVGLTVGANKRSIPRSSRGKTPPLPRLPSMTTEPACVTWRVNEEAVLWQAGAVARSTFTCNVTQTDHVLSAQSPPTEETALAPQRLGDRASYDRCNSTSAILVLAFQARPNVLRERLAGGKRSAAACQSAPRMGWAAARSTSSPNHLVSAH